MDVIYDPMSKVLYSVGSRCNHLKAPYYAPSDLMKAKQKLVLFGVDALRFRNKGRAAIVGNSKSNVERPNPSGQAGRAIW